MLQSTEGFVLSKERHSFFPKHSRLGGIVLAPGTSVFTQARGRKGGLQVVED
jgi:hypothetical protein